MIEITERDKKIFEFLFRLKYAKSDQIAKYINCSMTAFYERVKRLIKCEYLESEWVESINRKVYLNGFMIRKANERKSYRKKVKVNRYTMPHHLCINDVYIFFINHFNIDELKITTEREIYWKRTGILDKKKRIKIPDLVIEKDGKLVAIEIESINKNKAKLRSVFTNYSLYTSYYCVIYLCPTEGQKNYVIRTAEEEDRSFISAYTLDEFFSGVDVIDF